MNKCHQTIGPVPGEASSWLDSQSTVAFSSGSQPLPSKDPDKMLAVQTGQKTEFCFPARLSQNLRKLSSPGLARPEDALDSSMKWIMEHHDAWTRITLHSYYERTADRDYAREHFDKCMLDQLGILEALVAGASKVEAVVADFSSFSCAETIRSQHSWIKKRCLAMEWDIKSHKLSYQAALIVNYVEMTTMPGAELCSAVAAIWAFMMTSWTGWSRASHRVGTNMCPEYMELCNTMSDHNAMQKLLEAGELLDDCLKRANAKEMFHAQKTFEEMLKLISSFLDEATVTSKGTDYEFCLDCGRKGHRSNECAFRSHV